LSDINSDDSDGEDAPKFKPETPDEHKAKEIADAFHKLGGCKDAD
jgi:hypothetical protein